MSVYVNYSGNLMISCNGCGLTALVARDETDRLIANDWQRENGWKPKKLAGKWVNLCPECLKAYREYLRNEWIRGLEK